MPPQRRASRSHTAAVTYAEAGRCLSSGRDVATSAAAIADALRRIPSPPRPRPRHPPRRPGEGGRRREPAAARRRRARGGGQLRGGAAAVLWLRAGVPERCVEATHPAAMAGGGGGKVRRGSGVLDCRSAAWRASTRRSSPSRCKMEAARRGPAWQRGGWAEALGRGERETYIWVRSSTGPKMGHRDGCSVGGLFSPQNNCARPIFRFRLYCWR